MIRNKTLYFIQTPPASIDYYIEGTDAKKDCKQSGAGKELAKHVCTIDWLHQCFTRKRIVEFKKKRRQEDKDEANKPKKKKRKVVEEQKNDNDDDDDNDDETEDDGMSDEAN